MNSGAIIWAMMVVALLLTLPTTAIGITLMILVLPGLVAPLLGLLGLALTIVGLASFYALYEWFTASV